MININVTLLGMPYMFCKQIVTRPKNVPRVPTEPSARAKTEKQSTRVEIILL